MTVLSNIITPSNVLTTTNTATVTNKTLTSPTVAGMTVSDGTANGVTYLNGSKVLTSGSALVFDGTNLGIGTSSPVANGGYAGATFNGTNGGLLQFQNNGTNKLRLFVTSTQSVIDTGTGDLLVQPAGSNLIFGVNATEQMRLTSTGLGIGTSSPAYKFHVATSGVSSIAQFERTDSSAGLIIGADSDGPFFRAITSGDSIRWNNYNNTSEFMRLDSSGNLGIGTSTVNAKLDVLAANVALGSNGIVKVGADSSGADIGGQITFSNTNARRAAIAGRQEGGDALAGYLQFGTRGTSGDITERARIDSSGNLLVGTTSLVSAGKIEVATSAATNQGLNIKDTSGSNNLTYCAFFNSSGTVAGTITHTGSTTVAYNTSSDYRLKENIAPMTGALNTVAQLKPVTYKWKEDQTAGQGFIAHELQAVVPDCVTGAKDALDEDGKPVYQGIDTSFLVATLTAALQELNAKFEAYVASHP